MKRIPTMALSVLAVASFLFSARVSATGFAALDVSVLAELDDRSKPRTAVLKVEGVKCAGCSTRIRNFLKRTKGVSAVRSRESKKRIEVDYDASKVKPTQLAERVRDAGFKCSVVKVRKR